MISDSDGVVIKIRKISNVMRTISVVFFFFFAFHFNKIIKTPFLSDQKKLILNLNFVG
jgi:hypothetical protein